MSHSEIIVRPPRQFLTGPLITNLSRRSASAPPAILPDALLIEQVSVTYASGLKALDACSIRVMRGETVALLGSSGAGKSTLLRCVNGLVRASSGSIVVPGLPPPHLGRGLQRLRRHTAMVFQQHHLIGRQSVLANVLLGSVGARSSWASLLPFSQRERRQALGCLDRVGLLDKARVRADQLSGGQQQRVGIARALMQQPGLLLADEPVASLDPVTAESVLGLLRGICMADGLTAVVSLHQLDLAKRFADRIVGLAAGRVVVDCPASEFSAGDAALIYGSAAPAESIQSSIALEPESCLPVAAFV